jgi:hypothetical protein
MATVGSYAQFQDADCEARIELTVEMRKVLAVSRRLPPQGLAEAIRPEPHEDEIR